MSDTISRQAAIDAINRICPVDTEYDCTLLDRVDVRCVLTDLPSAQPDSKEMSSTHKALDTISRQAAIDAIRGEIEINGYSHVVDVLEQMPSVQLERKWTSCSNPPKHHKDVIVRGIEAIGNVTVHKVMQWDVDTWRPTDYAPSVMWKEWSEI